MTGIPPQDDPMLRLQYYQQTGQTNEANLYERYLRETGQYHPMPTKGAGASGTWGGEATVPRGATADIGRSALQGISMGTLAKPIAFMDALSERLPAFLRGKDTPAADPTKSLGDRYREYLDAQRTAQRDFEQQHPMGNAAIQLGAGAVPFLLTGGASAPAEIGELGTLARIGKAAKVGGTLGGVSGYLNTDRGWGLDAAKDAIVQGGEGALAGGILGGVAAPAAGWLGEKAGRVGMDVAGRAADVTGLTKLAEQLTEKAATAAPPLAAQYNRAAAMINEKLTSLGVTPRSATALGPQGKAASEITAARLGDQAAGSAGLDHPAVPGLNVYRGGRNLTQLGGDVIRQMGAGAKLRSGVEQAEQELPGLLTGELTRATGVSPEQATTKALEDALTAKKTELDQVFQSARDATKGQAITSPALDQVLRTDSGRQAYDWAKEQRAVFSNNQPLPSVKEEIRTPRPMPKIFSSETSWQNFLQQHPEMGFETKAVTKEVPDAQLLDLMRQHLSDLARLGETDVQGGKIATEAYANLRLWRDVQKEIPAPYQQAISRAAEINRQIDALMAGQDILKTPLIPSNVTARGRVASSLPGVIAEHSVTPPRPAQVTHDPESLAMERDYWARRQPELGPGSPGVSRAPTEVTSAGMEKHPFVFRNAQGQPVGEATFTNSDLGGWGVTTGVHPDYLRQGIGTALYKAAADAGIPVEEASTGGGPHTPAGLAFQQGRRAKATPPQVRPELQQGAGQAAQYRLQQLAANRRNPASAFTRSPEENLQMQVAMRSPEAGVRWNAALDAISEASRRNADLLRGSQTAERTAVREQRAGGPSLLDLAMTRGKGLVKTAQGAAQAQFRKNVNASITDILASRNKGLLSDAEAMAQIRANLLRNLTTGGAVAGAQQAERLNPRMAITPDSTTTP